MHDQPHAAPHHSPPAAPSPTRPLSAWLDHLRQDLRHALRSIRRSPAFAATVILTLGLGIGANAAMFAVVDRLMLRPPAYLKAPGRVDRVYLATKGWNADQPYVTYPYTRYLDLARWTTAFDDHAAFTVATHGVGRGAAARERVVMGTSASFWTLFEARPARGRFFGADDDRIPTGSNVAVLGWDYWQSALGGRDAIGEEIQVGSATYTIVGVAPRGFTGVDEGAPPAVYVPITAYASNEGGGSRDGYYTAYNWDWVQVLVRRRAGVSREAASADLTSAFRRGWVASLQQYPAYGPLEKARPYAVAGPVKLAAGPTRGLEARTLVWITGVALVVLLVACANVANLFLVRALRRRRELALRLAIGITPGRLLVQSLVESMLLATIGGGGGVAIAQWGGAALRGMLLGDTSTTDVVSDGRTLAVAALAALFAALVTCFVPLFLTRRHDLTAMLGAGSRTSVDRRSRGRTSLLVAQAALSFVLLVGAALFVRSLGNVRSLSLGYDAAPLLVARWESRGAELDSAGRAALSRRVMDAALALPEVERGAWITSAPFIPGTSVLNLDVPGVDSAARLGRFTYQAVTPGYFATVGTRIVRGRALSDDDRAGAPRAAVVSQAMAHRLWPGHDAIGRCLHLAFRSTRPDTMPCTTVVGVAEDAMHDPVADLPMRYYLADAQMGWSPPTLLLRMRRDPAAAAEPVRRALQAALPGEAIVTVRPAQELVDAQRRSWTLGAMILVGFGVLALVVAAVGLHGAIAFDVAQRTHELGVRVALGARGRDVARLVLGEGMRVAVVGLGVGAVLALGLGRWVQPLLFHQSARDPAVLAIVGALMLGVAMAACLAPARRATRASPSVVLRSE